MGDGSKNIGKSKEMEMENLSLSISTSRYSTDLLQRFMGSSSSGGGNTTGQTVVVKLEEEDDEIELNLGLSLGGRFGVDKSSRTLVRSSSIASCLPVVRDDNEPPAAVYTGLMRTSSLPVESEDEWRKRKELQTLRRMEAKRRRSEKQRNFKGEKEKGGLSVEDRKEIEVNLRGRLNREKCLAAVRRLSASVGSDFGGNKAITRKASYVGSSGGSGQLGSLVFAESRGASSSSVSGLERKASLGSCEVSIQSLQKGRSDQEIGNRRKVNTSETELGSQSNASENHTRETGTITKPLGDMPCVFTKGDGPNGRRVDGILYKYGRGEEVRIMCVCHGSFHSPAEFVKHAGGSDVDHPLKHIVINPSSSSLL